MDLLTYPICTGVDLGKTVGPIDLCDPNRVTPPPRTPVRDPCHSVTPPCHRREVRRETLFIPTSAVETDERPLPTTRGAVPWTNL